MVRKETEQDEISRLLDSYEDETLNQKMDAFAQSKKRRVNKHVSKEAEIPSFVREEKDSDTRIVLGAKDVNTNKEPENLSGTMAFDPNKVEEKKDTVSGTVVIDDNEIQSLLEDQKGPQLTRKKVSKKKDKEDSSIHLKKTSKEGKQKSSKQNGAKTVAVIVASVLGILLAILLIFGVVKLVQTFTSDEISSEQQEAYYQEIMDWIDGYDFYSEDEKQEIIQLESKYNKLTKEQKNQIDEAL